MARSNRFGVTLTEVIVIVVVLLLLMMLVLWGVSHARAEARRTQCMKNQERIARALQEYESQYKFPDNRFPGYANRLESTAGKTPIVTSWLVPILPYLHRKDVYEEWKRGTPTTPDLPGLVCPSDQCRADDQSRPWLGYVVNCGFPGDKDDTPATGVFHNHNVDGKPVTVSLDYITMHDGATNTLLLSENLQSGLWTDTEEANVGMVWWREPPECSRINECKDVGPRKQDIRYARPSSNHPGVVTVAFCDGHHQFLSEDIDYLLYQRLMAPDDERAGLPPVPGGCKLPLD